MTRFVVLAVLALALAACGVDGAPTGPKDKAPGTAGAGSTISVTGQAKIGIAQGQS